MRKHTKGLLALAATAALTLSACSSGTPGENGTTGDAEGSIKIGVKFDQPGLGFQDGADHTGFDVDVATYVAEKLGYSVDQIQWVESPSAQREQMLQTGQVDMIFATYSITDARKEVIDFAGPYFVAGQDLLVAADNTDINGPEDLAGKNLCSVTGSTSAQKIKDEHADTVNLLERPGYAECVTALVAANAEIDAVTTDDIILAGLAATDANRGKVKVVGAPFSTERYGVGLPKGSDRCEAINEAIGEMISDGTWEELVAKNTEGTGYTANAETNPPEQDACA
ncbi:extracellular solute-binding protein family 3 [Xylanimonas cellulosilytica DSM 15894]|uniref:Extracellular solute-binding protein family 3 n=1 Tax=Xylanimonas cellulosilytica (strain DSM 15894 / JCM 12276 / CECT 5975 / KCTC 9989 / LMG 20990 / NBRC 107835 / XIL07) TaxID=446471 RepID=D1C088_XYLCX|nr:glutamate ABC transporter substrate-binding protein [Xylanimonas cellulosilytica]ACZ30277.1 extracellular solute-binding protein family 3 [Xylanimonas cellulosilytica DSM 15894]